ncbi:tripartite tricarboxylate transporter TctB family protein [Vibrio sp. TH_r3]|uniref:tripartite tricarboxylate transporter TctB family protein n=1 Tax=Vibrio sp. TH_r3 TaxID=3082084 RepID=UPI00295387F4|nr:tripartite tricarboxylate transporter TctB family protein [Vibrio sp. TH_r3]MDV7103850.1 tripartite tricarboxylate transporter TctB family protein [Vibrio sp. TH_r3]
MLDRNVIFPSIVILLSAVAFYLIGHFDEPMYQEASVDAKFFPRVIVIGQIILCLALIFQHRMKAQSNTESQQSNPIFSKLSIFGLGYLVAYAVLMSFVGYLIASLTAFIAYLIYFKVKKPLYYLIAIGFVLSIYYLFGTVFVIVLPEGSLFY